MGLFSKKQLVKETDYKTWEEDFGFLNLILKRKKGITKEFLIGVYSTQKSDKDYLTDEEINPIIEQIVIEVLEQTGNEYQEFLTKKYFGSRDALIKFITEDIYVDLISDAINRNNTKIKSSLYGNIVNKLGILNKN